MRNIFKTLSILFFGSIFFLSCEIGLGSSVDTEAPQLEIQNPSPDAIIRGAFKIGGTWSDDGTIETVSVKLSRTDGKGKELEYQANFAESNDDSPNTWNCIINPQDSANTVLDGNYIAQVDITDGGKHTTTKTVQFAIDNTAPVIVLQRPSTKIDALQVDSYGQKFTLEGQAADDNNVSLIEVQIYADKECTTLLHTVPLSNVPNSINLDVAEFKENVETDYSKIYGSTQKSGQKNFYCKVVAYDGAVYYPYDRTQTPEDLKGNKTTIYYLYEDIATAVLGEVKITDVYHILSGIYGLEKESSRSAETNSLITKVKSALEKNVVNTGSFSLNPANNPTFSVSGKEPLQKDENGNVNFASGNYDITNGSQVIMEVTPGLDNIPLDGNSLKVYCIECDAKGTAKSGASKIYPATEMKKSGTTYKYTVSVKKQDGLVIGRNYLFGVDGYDEKKNNVVCSDNLGYGFHFSTSGAAPGLTILEPEAGSVTLANGKKLKISGTTTVEAGTPVITITDNKINKATLTFQESEAKEDENKQLIYTFSTEIDFTGESAYHELEIVSDLEGIKTTRTKSVSYDSENPVIAINSVNPIVEKTESNGQPKKCLNGEVQISFSLTDDFSFIDTTTNKPYFELWQNNEKKYTATFTSTNSAVTETVTVDTNKLIDNIPLEIKVFTWDRAGNKAEYSDKQYQIDQSTDKPQITPKNNINFDLKSEEDIKEAGNNENRISMGGTVSFTVADDDGIDYIAVYRQEKDDQGKIITENLVNRYPKEGSSKETQTPYSFILPSTSGYYLYRLEVKDIINTKAENNKQEYQFMIKATSPAPTIELISEEDSSTNFDNNADGYIKAGGAFVNTITVESVESPFTLWEKIDNGEYKKVENIKLENSEGKNYFKRKVSPIVTSTYYYKVEDSNEQYSSERSVKCKVDNDASTITPKSYPQTKQDTRVSQYTISGTAVDTDSGVNKVYIAFANEDEKYSDWKEVGGTENWYYTLKYAEDDNFKEYFSQEKHGIKYIKFKVVDKVGLENETKAIQFFYDTADPTAEITAYKTEEVADYTTLTSAGVKTGKAFSLKGKATDDWGIEIATLTQTFKPKQNESGEQQTEKSLTLTLELGTGGSWEVGNLPRSYEQGKEKEAALITGDYEYKLVVKDKAGNETQTILNVEVDITKPQITVNDLKGQNNNEFINTNNFSITGTIEESNLSTAEAKLMKKDGSNNPVATGQISPDNDGSFSWKVYEVADGEYTVEVYAIDSFGNNTTEKGSSFTVDTIAPVSTLTATGNQVYDNTGKAVTELTSGSTYYVKGNYTLSGTVTETNFKSAKLGEETLTASSGPWSKEITPSDETTKTQKITLEDKAGNKTVYTVYVAKDTSAPLLTVTSPTEGVNAASITVTGQVSDLGIGVESVSYELYKVEDTKETKIGETQTLTNKAGQFEFTSVDLTGEGKGEGKYKIKVTAQDKLGNKTTETVVNFMYDNTAPTLSDPKITTSPIRNDYTVGSGENQITYIVYAKDTFDIEVNATDLVSGVNTVTAESGNTKVTLTEEKDEQGNGTGKYKGTITAVLDKDNSTTITITATDKFNNKNTESITNIMVDKVAPTISNLTYPTTPQKNTFTISVSASDVIALAEVDPVKIKYQKNESDETLTDTELPMTLNNGVYKIELTPGTDSDSVHYIPDGNYTFTIEASDKAGNKASKSIEVVTDVTAPTWVTTPAISSTLAYTQEIKGENNQVSETRKYYKSNLININVKASDKTSGVKEIVYKLDSDQDTSTSNANITLDNLSEGMHTVSIKAVDEAENESIETILIFYIDTRPPLEPELRRIDSESGEAALEDYKNKSKSKLVNGQSDVTFVLSASDASSKASESDPEYMSGIKSVEVLRIASNNVNITGQKGADGQYTITIPKDNLKTGSVTVRITDNVGNTYEGTVFNLQLDNTPPVLKISSPANGATVNKTITISGATTDNDAVAQTVVTVKKGETEVKKETFTAGNTNELSWSLVLNTFVQNITDNATPADLTITVNATDNAGNTVSKPIPITVDQDKDRPVISFNNVTLGNAMNSSDSNYIWLKNTTELYGTVEDDDGITSMQISNDGNDWKDVTLNTAKTSWKFDVKTFFGDETADKVAAANGAHKIYFKVTDAKEKEFTSATSSTLDSVYLVDGENKYGTIGTGSAKPDSVLYVKVDTLFPEVVLTGARIGTTGDFSTAYSNMTLGGAQRTMQFKLTAKDSNGIESVSGTAEFDGASVTLSSPKVTAYNAGDKEIEDGESDAEYYIVSFTVDLENENAQKGLDGKDGRISLKFTGEDKARNSSAQTATINYDYKKPEVTITSPKDSNWVSGIVTAYGTIDSAATMYYALSPSDTITPAEPDAVSSGGNITGQTAESGTGNSHEVTSWSGINPEGLDEVTGSDITVTPKYSQIKGNGVQWFVYFDNQPSTELATHDVEFKKYLINSGITTKDAIDKKNFTTIVRLYLWVKSIDLAGNVTEEKFPILIDPQGDAPQVTISYPAKDGETLGGAVTLLGTASDTIGPNIGIKNVWVQIMSGTKNLAATPSVDDVNLWIEKGYNVFTDIKNSTPTQVTSAIASSANPANYYIQANVSGSSWSLKINGNDEFSPSEGSTNNIVYRVYAQDKDNNLSKYQTQYSIFDADNPVLSDLYLRQYSDNKNGTGEITASRPYEDDMWIKGDWWLCGTVKDTQGIGSLKVGEESITVVGDENKEEKFQYEISTTGSYAGNKTISIVAEDKASPFHTTKKTCSINFDNKDPDSFEPVIANNIIQNRNGFFTFSAEVKEDAVSGAAQSGFKYLAFYFTRGDKVYDIMRPKDSKDSKDSKDDVNSAINTSGLTKGDDGLFWKELSITRDPKNLAIITLSAADANIHTGGLCKIGGSIYMIKNANGRTIELDGSPEIPADDTSPEDTPKALFAIANVVNNNIESGNGTKSTSLDSYGYFESISNDDGDHMVESVLKTGTTWKWEANINSRNIPDGEVTLHYVAFDAAGNYSDKEISGLQIANNAPRLASVKVWTDYNGNGIEDDNEHKTKYYSKKTVVIGGQSQTKSQDLTSDLLLSGNDKDEANDGSAFMTIKAETKLIPELVGGNGDLYYTYKIKNNKEVDWSGITPSDGSFAKGNDDGIDDEAGNGGHYVVDDENTAYISGTIYDGKTTDKNPIVITTDILGNLENNENNSDPTWFEYVIYDSTDGCKDWSDSNYTSGRLSAKFKVALNVQYNDEVKPQVSVRPFYWNSKTDNSVCWDSTSDSALSALGHIELEGDLTPTITADLGEDPKVSGKIKIEGYAFDNIKLKELYVQFDGHKNITSKTLAATYTTSENTTSWVKSSTAEGIENTWDFEATDVFNNSEGHLVYWTLTVDTQAVDTQAVDTQAVDTAQVQVARLDQKVTVIAKDERGKEGTTTGGLESSASSGNEGQSKMLWKDVKTSAGALTMFYTDEACSAKADTSTSDDATVYLKEKLDYQMDIVPYITGVKTSLSDLDANNPSIYNRTALGHYAVNSTETVDIYGFNLAGGTLSDSASASVSLGTANTNASENAYGLSGAQYFSVSASTLKSGNIEIKVNEIPTLNNINKSEAKGTYSNTDTKYENHYNRTPNGLNNNLLEDDVIFDVWEFDSDAAVPRSGQVRQPIMKISPATGMIQFAFANGPLYFSMGGGNYLQDTTSHDFWSQSYDFFTSIGYTVDDLGYTYGVCAGGDINSQSADVFALHSSRFHNPECNRQQHGNMANPSGLGLEQIAQNNGTSKKTNYVFLKERIMSPSLGTTISGTSTNLYLAYIDNINSEIRFKSGTTTAINSNDSVGKDDKGRYLLDKTQEFGMFKDKYIGDPSINNGNILPGAYDISDVDVVANSNSAEYLSLGVVPSTVTKTNDVVVLVWNEGTTLKYAYNESPLQSGIVGVNEKSIGTWTVDNGPFGSGIGKYCKVAVDKKGGIHVAAYDQMKGDLKYAYRSGYKSGTWQTCTVDSYGIIGSEISLDVAMSVSGVDAKPIPYISYYADSAVKPKIAYLNDVSSISDGATRDYFTQKWEVSYLPTSSIVPKDHINVGLWKNGSTGEIVNSMIAGSSDNNSFTNWQNNYGTYKNNSLVTKGTVDVNNKVPNASWGYKFANGTQNPMVAYQVGSGVSSTIETAQMK